MVAVIAIGCVCLVVLVPQGVASPRSDRPVWGFLPGWDPNALASLRAHASQLSVVLPTGPAITAAGGLSGSPPRGLVSLVHRLGPRAEPVVSDFSGGAWRTGVADRVLRSPRLRRRLAATIAREARAGGWDGVNLDLEALRARDRGGLVALAARLRADLPPADVLSADVPAESVPSIALRALGARVNDVVVMAYDAHASAGSPGPIAPPPFVAAARRRALAAIPPGKLVLGLPSYAYAWRRSRPPVPLTVPDALQVARRGGVLPRWSAAAGAPAFRTGRGSGRQTVWLADAGAFAADLHVAGPPRSPIAVWRLGSEDPGIWPMLTGGSAFRRPAIWLDRIAPPPRVQVTGAGDVMQGMPGAPGWRTVMPSGREAYRLLPRPWAVRRSGAGRRDLAITFDDGPSGYTPQILRELARLHVPAAFFVVGENAARYPGALRQEMAAGAVIGDHTFLHPDLAAVSSLRTGIEILATSRLITGITGHRPVLVRPPYAAWPDPAGTTEVKPLVRVEHLGYTPIGASIDSGDYMRPGVPAILHNVLASLHYGDIVLFHDGGGDRSQTVAALPVVIHALRARGYHLVSLATLMHTTTARLMPAVHGPQLWLSRAFAWSAEAWYAAVDWIARLGVLLLVVLGARIVLVGALALRHRRRAAAPPAGPPPRVTVLVPAFDEATVIRRTLDALQAQVGADPEIIVIDDGSRDGTAALAERPGVRVARQANTGKWAALNRGLALATGDVVVAIDADTVLDRHAVARLARWFADPAIGAVSGTTKVANRHTLLTLWQHVEYVTSFNLDRRAYSDLNAITVVPGAIGAWRRSAVLAIGGYRGRTLAEDCDLTVALRRAGWRIVHEPAAVAWTEAPETIGALARQRLRWTFGTLQVLWLNRGALFRPREGALGAFALPYAWLYQVVLSLLAPAVDVLILIALLTGGWRIVALWLAVATVGEMAVSWLAFRMEGEPAWPVLSVPLQRVAYRQLMYVSVVRSIGRAIRGTRLGWGKLARTGAFSGGPAPS